jgi:hypothetical protein
MTLGEVSTLIDTICSSQCASLAKKMKTKYDFVAMVPMRSKFNCGVT